MPLWAWPAKLCTECGETRTRPHITLFSSQLQSPNAFSDTSEPSWGWAFCAVCWDMLGICGSSSLVRSSWKSQVTGNRYMVVSDAVETFCEFQSYIISDYNKEWRCWALLPNRGEKALYQNAFLNMLQWPVICDATLCKSYNFASSWCSPLWGELETICEAAQSHE